MIKSLALFTWLVSQPASQQYFSLTPNQHQQPASNIFLNKSAPATSHSKPNRANCRILAFSAGEVGPPADTNLASHAPPLFYSW